ncbi:nuclear transport factor 2 family protein [Bradyrhizobium sp. Ec3.3]|uniref:nuclear transport factor 2 family protein n=1 Tax=Bradyrhizobium sp. Ec3.3 TaxID=189753 RepID=UPI00048136A0|nr:nuclear transport factor 2 family protein [Bradyrhizobium sp. Ec3.3]
MSFHPMAAAVDWLDAYRAGDVDAILEMFADDAVIHCSCGSIKIVTEKESLRAYWVQRIRENPAYGFDYLYPTDGGAMISYIVRDRAIAAVLTFNASGQIERLSCGTSNWAGSRTDRKGL